MHPWLYALLGGALIGCASALLLRSHGRIAGVSGICGGALERPTELWRVAFLVGLVLAGLSSTVVAPHAVGASPRSLPLVAIAGLLVGVGTRLGGGCTSGHGVCGIARRSGRSLIAVMTFMFTGVLTVLIVGAP